MHTRAMIVAGGLAALTLAASMGLAGARTIPAARHCDTLDGPVAKAGRAALDKGELTGTLRWIKADAEGELSAAFKQALAVRGRGEEARALADMYFLETLVRLHRAGEGEPYMGLKPVGTDVGPAVAGADRALETGSADALVALIGAQVERGIRDRFDAVHALQATAGNSVESGRDYVAAYVEFVHYVERLHDDATRDAAHAGQAPEHGH